MATRAGTVLHPMNALLAAFGGSVALIVLCHALWAGAAPASSASYVLTEYATACFGFSPRGAFLLAGVLLVSALLGRVSGSGRPIAIGMVLPLPLATALEIARDPTSHNLLPFEVALYWAPLFLAALAGTRLARRRPAPAVGDGG